MKNKNQLGKVEQFPWLWKGVNKKIAIIEGKT